MGENEFEFEWENGKNNENVFFHTFEDGLFDSEHLYIGGEVPPMYHVMLLNDDETSLDFVIFVLQTMFHTSYPEAEELAHAIDMNEMAICGTFTRDVAETKVMEIISFAHDNGKSLKCVMQREYEDVVKES